MRNAIQINLDVLALNKGTYDSSLYRWWNLGYSMLSRYRSAVPDPLNGSVTLKEDKAVGVYLHMTLPRELRTCVNGEFPLIPNRWLVVRTCGNDCQNAKSVIIESDCPDNAGTPTLLSPERVEILAKSADDLRSGAQPNQVGSSKMLQLNLGKVFDLANWEERAANDVFLTASENGDLMFSAYCFRNRNILSYFDPMTDVSSSAKVNYYVVGWLSSDENSPLYFSSSTGINWNRNGGTDENDPYFAEYDVAPVNVALGTNTNEAYLALLAQKLVGSSVDETIANKIITGFSAVLGDYAADLEKPNAASAAATHRHTANFSVIDTAPRFTGEGKNFNKINRLCDEIETLRKSIVAGREQLWLDFWRYHFYEFLSPIEGDATKAGKNKYAESINLSTEKTSEAIPSLIGDIAAINNRYQELDALLKENQDAQGNCTKRYYKPLSPCVIISGVDSPLDIDPNFGGHATLELPANNDAPCEIPGIANLPAGIAAAVNLMLNDSSYAAPHKQPYDPIYVEWQTKYINIPFENWKFDGFRYNLKSGVHVKDFENRDGFFTAIGGIAPLSGHFEGMVRDKFAKLGESLGKEFNADLSALALLSQEMAGFTEAIAQRDTRPFGTPTDGDKNDNVTINGKTWSFGNLLGFDNSDDHLVPTWFPKLRNDALDGTPYFDMRCGAFAVNDLIVYDKFGRKTVFITSTQGTGTKYGDNYPVILGDTMRGQGRYALLPPAFLMDTTLVADITPVCFVTHNVVNESLILHENGGEYLGEITVTSGNPVWKSKISVTGAIEAFVKSVVGESDRFDEIKKQIGSTLASVGGKPESPLSAALGRPLILLDVKLAFDFYGEPHRNINWADDGSEPAYWSYKFPFSIGDPGEREDGFVAAFSKDNYKNMTPSGAIVDCRLGVKSGAEFMAICVPNTYFTVRTGLLPAFKFSLPEGITPNMAQRIDVSNALIFKSGDGASADVYIPAQADGSELSFCVSGNEFSVTPAIKETSSPIVTDGVLFRKRKQLK